MKQFVAATLAVFGAATLAGCGGPSAGSYEALGQEALALSERTESYDPTLLLTMPDSGRVTYSGIAAFADLPIAGPEPENVAGRAEVTADFAANAMTGTLSEFVTESERAVGGTLALRNGVISGNTAEGDVSGQLSSSYATLNVDGEFLAQFGGLGGVGADAVAGIMSIDATSSRGGTTTTEGVFLAE
ncbi:MAG: transferrin-binding protein-like solute binding protein [Pseudooceanicola sp.]